MNTFSKDQLILGYPTNVTSPFTWAHLHGETSSLRTFDDIVELLEQLEAQGQSDVVVQAQQGTLNALKLCRVVLKQSSSRVHLIAQSVTESERVTAQAMGVTSIHEVGTEAAGLRPLISRHATKLSPNRITIGTLEIDHDRRKISVGANPISTTKTEFEVLWLLASQPGETVTRQELISQIWGNVWFGAPNVLDTHITHLRAKLGSAGHPASIVNVHGVGFYFEPQYPVCDLTELELAQTQMAYPAAE